MQRIEQPLRGLSHFFSLNKAYTICHAAHIRGPFQIVLALALEAAKACAQRHPHMRATLHPLRPGSNRLKAVVAPLEEYEPTVEYLSETDWKKVAKDGMLKPVNREKGPLFWWTLVLPGEEGLGHVLLFSEHSVSDGFSGMRILHDFLSFISTKKTAPPLQETYQALDLWGKPPSVELENVVWNKLEQYTAVELPKHEPLFPTMSLSYQEFYYDFCSESSLKLLKDVCKNKGLTLHAPLVACLLLAVYPQFSSAQKENEVANIGLDVDFNLRNRLPNTLGNDHVGAFISQATISWEQNLNMSFWDLARNAKTATDKTIDLDYMYKLACLSDKFPNNYPILMGRPDGITANLEFSNMGKFPFALEYPTSIGQDLVIDAVHLTNSALPVSSQLTFYATCCKRLALSLVSRTNEVESRQIFDRWVWLVENCHSFEEKTSLLKHHL